MFWYDDHHDYNPTLTPDTQVSAVVEHQHNLATQLSLRTAGEAEATRQLRASTACYSSAVAKLDAAVAGRREAEAALKTARAQLRRQAKEMHAAQQAAQEGERTHSYGLGQR